MASYNFNKPVITDAYDSDILPVLRSGLDSVARMLDGTADTNVPTGAKRKNSGQKYRLEEWNGASWNMVEPGLGDLTQAEVDQLATIGTTTISATQWGYLGGLPALPLHQNDLAANGGSVPEVDRNNVFSEEQEIVNNTYWRAQSTLGATTRLLGVDLSDRFVLGDVDGKTSSWRIFVSGSVAGTIESDGGFEWGAPTGGSKGTGTLNAEALYDNGNRVYSASNAPETTDLSGVTASAAELNTLDGFTGTTADMNTVLTPYATTRVTLNGDFGSSEVVCEKIGNTVTITNHGSLLHTSGSMAISASNVIPSQFRPTSSIEPAYTIGGQQISRINIGSNGTITVYHRDFSGSPTGRNSANLSVSFVIT